MAYHLHHFITFYNCLNEKLVIELYKKDVVPDEVTDLLATAFSVQYPTGEGDKFDTITSKEAKLSLFLQNSDDQTFDDFIVTFPDEWKMIAYDDDEVVFVGFLTPGEGRSEFQDKPYEITLSAVDGLGLLKGVPLTKDDGTNFTGVNLIIDYILAILNKTGLELNLRLFSSIVEESMQDRLANPQADTFNQTGLHARTFLKDAIQFHDCYTCLERILSEYFTLYQWYGRWVILRIGELQDSPGAKMWYTEYDNSGTILEAEQSLYNAGAVGRDRLVHPVEKSQFIGSNFAVKSSRYTYNYNVWPEIPTNNKFERGTLFETIDIPGPPQQTQKKYTIDDWLYGITNPSVGATQPPNGMLSTTDPAYRLSTLNAFNVETNREIVLERQGDVAGHRFLRSEGIPVSADDKIAISLDYKTSAAGTGTRQYLMIMLERSSGTPYRLDQVGAIPSDGIGILTWTQTTAMRFLAKSYQTGEDASVYTSFSISPPPLPVDGTLYVLFMMFDPPVGRLVYYKNFNFEYFPFIAGSNAQIKGDYAQTSQNDNYKDTIDEEVFISDSPKKVLQGALYRENLTDLTTPTWHRFNVAETRHFKELGELARFNNNYRRMWKIDGQFDGLKFTPFDDGTILEPLSFHRHFTFPDSTLLNGKYFVLVPPLTINYSEGRADMNFIEVLDEDSDDVNDTGDNHIPLQYIFG